MTKVPSAAPKVGLGSETQSRAATCPRSYNKAGRRERNVQNVELGNWFPASVEGPGKLWAAVPSTPGAKEGQRKRKWGGSGECQQGA